MRIGNSQVVRLTDSQLGCIQDTVSSKIAKTDHIEIIFVGIYRIMVIHSSLSAKAMARKPPLIVQNRNGSIRDPLCLSGFQKIG